MENAVSALLRDHYELSGFEIKRLNGYENLNFKVTLKSSESFVLKLYPDLELFSDLMGETKLLNELKEIGKQNFPRPIQNVGGDFLIHWKDENEQKWLVRLLTFVEGNTMLLSDDNPQLLSNLGSYIADLNNAVSGLSITELKSRRNPWNLEYYEDNIVNLSYLKDTSKKKLVQYFSSMFRAYVLPISQGFRRSIIQGDVNENNVLVSNDQVIGLIDFGDCCESWLINELAICGAYVLMEKSDPMRSLLELIKGYHNNLSLESIEIESLYYLISARLCTTIINAEKSIVDEPWNEYAGSTGAPAWGALQYLVSISPVKFSNTIKQELGKSITKNNEKEQQLAKRLSLLGPSLSLSYSSPIFMNKAIFQYMFDHEGNRYLDAYNNIPHIGHSHPELIERAHTQMLELNTNTRYLGEEITRYSDKLLSKFPSRLNKVFFVNSGSAASDLALRMASVHTEKKGVAVIEHGYHGNTRLSIDVSHYKFGGKGGHNPGENISVLPLPDEYRGEKGDFKSVGEHFASEAKEQLKEQDLAAFIAEPIVGCGGQVPLAEGYLRELYPFLKEKGAVCISDEVQVGFGRMGTHFWGFEMHGIEPDMVILGKPIGNGHPMAAVVTTEEIAESFHNGMEFFSSFGGNNVSCVIGETVLDIIEQENLQENAKIVGQYFQDRLNQLKDEFHCIGDVRGSGLFIGVDIVKDKFTKEEDHTTAHLIKNGLKERFILSSTDGPKDSVIKMKPPMCFSKENVDEVIDAMNEILKSL